MEHGKRIPAEKREKKVCISTDVMIIVFRSKETALGLKAVHAEEVGRKPETSHVENA